MAECSCNPTLGRQRQDDASGLIASQLVWFGRFHSSKRYCLREKGGLYLRYDTQNCPLASSPTSVFVCECVCQDGGECMLVCIDQRFTSDFSSVILLFFEIGSLIRPENHSFPDPIGAWPLGTLSPLLLSQHWVYRYVLLVLAFYMENMHPNLGCHDSMASTFLSKSYLLF